MGSFDGHRSSLHYIFSDYRRRNSNCSWHMDATREEQSLVFSPELLRFIA
jgi:hypothetical protein